MKETSAIHIGFLIDHDIQVPAKFVEKISKRKIDAETNPQHHTKRIALHHFTPGEFLSEGQQSIMNTAVTQEERDRVTRPAHPEAAPSSSRDDRNRTPRNVNNWQIGWTKERGRASSRARMMMIKPVNVNVGVDREHRW